MNIDQLPSADWGRLACLVERFESAWQQGDQPELSEFLPQGSERYPALVELVHVDLERRWKTGAGRPVEFYLEHYPELAADPEQVLGLIAAEYKHRLHSGTAA